jgi:hypothetical protein
MGMRYEERDTHTHTTFTHTHSHTHTFTHTHTHTHTHILTNGDLSVCAGVSISFFPLSTVF